MSKHLQGGYVGPERIVVVGYGPVGARLVEELLPLVQAGRAVVTVVGAETADAYNRVLIAEYAVGNADREALELSGATSAREAGVQIMTGTSATVINRTRRTLSLSDGTELPYDRLVLATGARANVPTLDGVKRLRRDRMIPSTDAVALDSAEAPLPRGVTVLRDLEDAHTVLAAVQAGKRIVVLGAGVLGMEIALAAAHAGGEACVVYHGDIPMARNLDRGGGTVLARSARRAGVTMVNHSRAESILSRSDADGVDRFDALICADGKQIAGDLLLLSCGVHARAELAYLSGLPVSSGILVDESLRSWGDPNVYAIGDCAHVAAGSMDAAVSAGADESSAGSAAAGFEAFDASSPPSPSSSLSGTEGSAESAPSLSAPWSPTSYNPSKPPAGGPSGLVGPGWRQADWLAARFTTEITGADASAALAAQLDSVVMLKSEGVDVVAAGDTSADPWDDASVDKHSDGCHSAPLSVSQWADPEHGRYVKMVTRDGILTGFVCVGMPRTAAELTLLFQRGSELPADRSVLLRHDGPDYVAGDGGDSFAPDATVCWCNGVTVGDISDSAGAGNTTVACIGAATRAGTGCGGCQGRIGEVLEQFAATHPTPQP